MTKIPPFHILDNLNAWFYIKPYFFIVFQTSLQLDKNLKQDREKLFMVEAKSRKKIWHKYKIICSISLVSTDSLLDYSPFLQSEHSYTPKRLCDFNQSTLSSRTQKKRVQNWAVDFY